VTVFREQPDMEALPSRTDRHTISIADGLLMGKTWDFEASRGTLPKPGGLFASEIGNQWEGGQCCQLNSP
jgi:hypothetical protein